MKETVPVASKEGKQKVWEKGGAGQRGGKVSVDFLTDSVYLGEGVRIGLRKGREDL